MKYQIFQFAILSIFNTGQNTEKSHTKSSDTKKNCQNMTGRPVSD